MRSIIAVFLLMAAGPTFAMDPRDNEPGADEINRFQPSYYKFLGALGAEETHIPTTSDDSIPVVLIPEEKKVILFLDTFGDKDQWPFWLFKKKMERAFPDRSIRSVMASSVEELGTQLDSVLLEDEVISHLYFDGHGDSKEGQVYLGIGSDILWHGFIEPGHKPYLGYETFDDDEYDAGYKLLNYRSNRAFRGIQGRFIKDSKIIFNNCKLLAGNTHGAKKQAEALAQLFKINSGTLYAHSVDGTSRSGLFRTSRFSPQTVAFVGLSALLVCDIYRNTTLRQLPLELLKRGIAGAVVAFYHDSLYNKGYLCQIRNEAVEEMREARLHDEMRTFASRPVVSLPGPIPPPLRGEDLDPKRYIKFEQLLNEYFLSE